MTRRIRGTLKQIRHIRHKFLRDKCIKTWEEGGIVLQIHENSSNPLPSILGVELIKEVIKVRFVFLPHFIVENLNSLSMLCTLYSYHEKCSRLFSNIFSLNYSFPSYVNLQAVIHTIRIHESQNFHQPTCNPQNKL
jgi:hypothetical protein